MKLKIYIILISLIGYSNAQNVIVAVIDGARYTETFGAEATNIPHIWNDLKPQGTIYTNYFNTGETYTNPGHASILTGTWQYILNDGSQRPDKPTVFEYFRKEKSALESENYVIAGKAKLNMMSYSTFSDYGASFTASVSASDINDNEVYTNLTTIMDTDKPKLIIVNFPEVDRIGHSIGTPGVAIDNYLAAITNVDLLIYNLWNKIQSDVNYQNNTTLFVTNDHGRHTTDISGHGDQCEGCTHLMLLALGRNVTPNQIINDERLQIDIAPTIGDLLSFETPEADGISLFDGTNPLPVELTNFSYSVVENNVLLDWQTATEINNYGFEIQRQNSELSSRNSEWNKIGFVVGSGNSNANKEYSFMDIAPTGNKIKYRLKQIDTDGNYEYSEQIEVELLPQKFELFQNYPNPFNPATKIKYSIPTPLYPSPYQGEGNREGLSVSLVIYDILGNEVAVLINEPKQPGIYEVEFQADKLSSGFYLYRISAGSFTDTKKMILLR